VLTPAADSPRLGHRTAALLADLDDLAATTVGPPAQDIHHEVRERLARSRDDRS